MPAPKTGKMTNCFSSSNPHHDILFKIPFWHAIWHVFWHSFWILFGISADIFAGISCCILSGALSGILSGISSCILSGKSYLLIFYPASLLASISCISSGIPAGIASGTSSGIISGTSYDIFSGNLSGIRPTFLFLWHSFWHSLWRLKPSAVHSDRDISVEVRRCPLRWRAGEKAGS